jgi:hypothetical protein
VQTDLAAMMPPALLSEAQLCAELPHRIPKIVIGNPGEQRELAWDIIPNWRNFRTIDPAALNRLDLPTPLARLLHRCHEQTVWDLVDHTTSPARMAQSMEEVTENLKAARSLGLVEWDFTVRSDDGVLLRRRGLGQEPRDWKWFFLPPLTKHVFDQCSGAWSCEQISARISDARIVPICVALVEIGVVAWIDDIHHRERRRRQFSITDLKVAQ